jgi:hypothetical protein
MADDEHQRRIRDLVSRALDEDGYVLGLAGALEAVAEHARLRAVDESAFLDMARAAYHAVLREHALDHGAPLEE